MSVAFLIGVLPVHLKMLAKEPDFARLVIVKRFLCSDVF